MTGVQPSQLDSVIALLCRSDLLIYRGVTGGGKLNARGVIGPRDSRAKWHSPTKGRRWRTRVKAAVRDGLTRADLCDDPGESSYHELAAFSGCTAYIQPRDLKSSFVENINRFCEANS